MNIPDCILEEIFTYLNWKERACAARVCRKWLFIFQSPILWRKVVFRPPNHHLTRIQYDLRCYRLSCCLKKIGHYIRCYQFLKTDDLFLLHRTLSLVAKFFEYASYHNAKNLKPSESLDEENEEEAYQENVTQPGNTQNPNCKIPKQDSNHDCNSSANEASDMDSDGDNEPFGFNFNNHSYAGDPDAEATLRVVLRLQEHEFLRSDSDDEDEDLSDNSLYLVSTLSVRDRPNTFRPRFHSQPMKFAKPMNLFNRACKNPPLVSKFELDFQCEVNYQGGFVYGTGGALLNTIRRVLRQLDKLEHVKLTDLFLIPSDARGIILDLNNSASQTLCNLNLVHLINAPTRLTTVVSREMMLNEYNLYVAKVESLIEINQIEAIHLQSSSNWYLLDPRWLSAKSNKINENPLADLSHLFPKLMYLTLSPTQLTGPMLLRSLFNSCLTEVCLVQTDLTWYSISRLSEMNDLSSSHLVNFDDNDQFQFNFNDPNLSDLIDWLGDVPTIRKHQRLNDHSNQSWQPISSAIWLAALSLRPALVVHLKLQLVQSLTYSGWSYLLSDEIINDEDYFQFVVNPIHYLRAFWPLPMAPVQSITFKLNGEIKFLESLLQTQNRLPSVWTYSTTLTSIIICLDENILIDDRLDRICSSVSTTDDVNNILIQLAHSCKNLKLLAFGGNLPFIHILALLSICSMKSEDGDQNVKLGQFKLLIQKECCKLEPPTCPPVITNIPKKLSSWYLSMISEINGSNLKNQLRVAECCLSTILHQARWHFLNESQFQSQLSKFL